MSLVRTFDFAEYLSRINKIKKIIKGNYITTKEIADETNLPISTISAFFSGRNNSAEVFIRLEKYLYKVLKLVYDYTINEYVSSEGFI